MSTIRQQRISTMLFEELGIMISSELEDPNLSLTNVTSVDVSRDLRNVKVYVIHQNPDVPKSTLIKHLRKASSFLRNQIAIRCGLRHVPELSFHYDEAPKRAARVDELLRQLATEREAGKHE